MMKQLIFLCVIVLMASCGGSREANTSADMSAVKELIEGGVFEFEAQWAMPLTGQDMVAIANAGLLRPGDNPQRINLIGNPNYVRVMKDSVSGHLPYYGEQQFNVQFNSTDQGINFNETARNMKVKFNARKNQYEVSFNVSAKSNGYQLFLTVFPGMGANLRITSASRNFISYQGEVRPLEQETQ